MSRVALLVLALGGMLPVHVAAQWLHHPPGIPRTAEGKPNLAAPAPRTADGKPDLRAVGAGARPSSGRLFWDQDGLGRQRLWPLFDLCLGLPAFRPVASHAFGHGFPRGR
jgi:hypothetical protein